MSSRNHPWLGTLVYRVQKECNVTVDCLLFVVIVTKYYPHRLKKKKNQPTNAHKIPTQNRATPQISLHVLRSPVHGSQ